MREFTVVQNDLYIEAKAFDRMRDGSEELGYISADSEEGYVKVSSDAFQPAIKINDNTFSVTFIMK